MKVHLLSHKWQKPAIWTFIIIWLLAVLLFAGFLGATEKGISIVKEDGPLFRCVWFLVLLVQYGSLAAMIFSKEKVEDEYISKLRLETIAQVVIVFLCIVLLTGLISPTLPSDSIKEYREWRVNFISKNTIYLPLIYFCVFKHKLKHQK